LLVATAGERPGVSRPVEARAAAPPWGCRHHVRQTQWLRGQSITVGMGDVPSRRTGVTYVSYFDVLKAHWPNEDAAWLLRRSRPMTARHSAPVLTFTHGDLPENGAAVPSTSRHRGPSLARTCEPQPASGRCVDFVQHVDFMGIDHWTNCRGNETRHLLWVNEEFLVVVAERRRKRDGFQYLQLITAYCTLEESRKKKLRQERDARNG
jgi:hypothetical protein